MTTIESTHLPTETPTRPTARPRSARGLAIAAVAAPLALATGVALHPADTSDAAASLGRIAGDDRARWAFTHLLEPASWLALAVVFLAMGRLAAGRGRPAVRAGAALAAVGAAATALIVYGHGEAYFQMTAGGMDRPAMEELYTHFQSAMPLAAPFTMAFRLGLLVLGFGLFRSGAVPRWAAGLLAVVPMVMVPMAEAPTAVTAVVVGGPLVAALAGSAPALRRAWSA